MAIGIQSIATNDAEALDVLEKVVGFQLILGAELPRLSPADKIKIWRKIAEFAKLIAHSLQWPTAAIIWGPTEPCYAQHASALFAEIKGHMDRLKNTFDPAGLAALLILNTMASIGYAEVIADDNSLISFAHSAKLEFGELIYTLLADVHLRCRPAMICAGVSEGGSSPKDSYQASTAVKGHWAVDHYCSGHEHLLMA